MKHFYFMAFLCLLSTCALAQDKDCKLIDLQSPTKQKFKGFIATSNFGKLTLYKLDGKLNGQYMMRDAYTMFNDYNNVIDLKIDSVRFTYADNSTVTVKVTGKGTCKNSSAHLKPTFDKINFTFVLDAGQQRTLFEKPGLKGFTVIAEKEGQYDDTYNQKQSDFFTKNIACLEAVN